MTTGTNVPAIQWTSTGLVVPTAAAILAGVQADINAAFGGNLNSFNLTTPQGQLASSLAAIVQNSYAALAYFVNNVNPAAAQSFMQDAIGYLYYLKRNPGTPTSVQCVCTGLQGTVIPVGAQAQDTSGNSYSCTQAGTIGAGGNVTLTFENVAAGPTPCAANTLTVIYQAIPGWDSINNPSAGTLGTNVESQAAFAARMQASGAVNGQGALGAIYGSVAALPEVTSVYCVENDTSSPVTVGSTDYSLAANSIYVAVLGGVSASIAQAIWTKKSPGCNMDGNTSVTVYDTTYPAGNQPSYTIKYNVPNTPAMSAVVSISNSTLLPSNYATLIQNALLAAWTSGVAATTTSTGAIIPAVPAVGIASNIVAANYFAPILQAFQPMSLLSVLFGTLFTGTGSVSSSSTTLTITAVTSGFLAKGCIISGTDIPSGTYIVQQLTGTQGGAGTYQMSANASATASGVTVTSATGNMQSYQAGIDQAPTLVAANISVVLV